MWLIAHRLHLLCIAGAVLISIGFAAMWLPLGLIVAGLLAWFLEWRFSE